MDVYLLDGTYELFRHYYALPSARDDQGREVAAVRGVLRSVLGMVTGGVTHLGVATDHVIESFRNRLWPGYKTSAGVDAALLAQFPLLEDALTAMGSSMALVWTNLRVLLVWAAIVLVLFLASLATGMLGLVVIYPLLGHATWHAYRAVQPGRAP